MPHHLAVLTDFPEEGWRSMDLCGDMLLDHLPRDGPYALEAARPSAGWPTGTGPPISAVATPIGGRPCRPRPSSANLDRQPNDAGHHFRPHPPT